MGEVSRISLQPTDTKQYLEIANKTFSSELETDKSVFFKADTPIKVLKLKTPKEIDGDAQKNAAKKQNKIGEHIAKKARVVTNKEASRGFLKAAICGVAGALLGVGIVAAVGFTLPLACLASGIGLVGGAAIGVGHTVKKISDNLYDEYAANNYINDSEHTKRQGDKTALTSNNFFINWALKNSDYRGAELSEDKITEAMKELKMDRISRTLYIEEPTEANNSNVIVHYTEVDSQKYNNVGDDKRNFEGRTDAPTISLNRAYFDLQSKELYDSGFLAEFTDKDTMTGKELVRFIEIAKALSTDEKLSVSKEDALDPKANSKEDADFFDFNNDNKINIDDLILVDKLLKAKANNIDVVREIDGIKLPSIDLNGDNKLDQADVALYEAAKAKLDINQDNSFDKKDKDILTKYLLARVSQCKATANISDILFENFGFDFKMQNIKKEKAKYLNNLVNKILDLN